MKFSNRSLIVVLLLSLSVPSSLDAQLGPLRQRAAMFGRQLMNKAYQTGGKLGVQRLRQSTQWKRLQQFWKPRAERAIRSRSVQKQPQRFKSVKPPVVPKREFATASKFKEAGVSGGVKPVVGSRSPNWKMIGAIGGAAAIAGYEYSKEKEGISVTENYLKIVGFDKVGESLGISSEAMMDLKKLTEEKLIPKEKELSRDYYVFYHGQDQVFLVPEDLQKMLYERLNKTKVESFEFLRALDDLYEDADLKHFLEYKEDEVDNAIDIKNSLLSTNTSFPGNYLEGESSFSYYARSKSVRPPDMQSFYFKIIKSYFPKMDEMEILSFVNRLQSLQRDLSSEKFKYGLLLQIFIPKKDISKYVYSSGRQGVLGDMSYVETSKVSDFCRWLKSRFLFGNRELVSFLDKITTNPKEIKNLGHVQMRILLDANLFGNPNSGVKIYRYHHIPETYIKEYDKQLTKIIDDLISYKKEIDIDDNRGYISHFLKSIKEYPSRSALTKIKQIYTRDNIIKLLSKKELTQQEIIGAIQVSKELIQTDDVNYIEFPMRLFARSAKEGKAISELIIFARNLLANSNWGVKYYGMMLYRILADNGVALKEAETVASKLKGDINRKRIFSSSKKEKEQIFNTYIEAVQILYVIEQVEQKEREERVREEELRNLPVEVD